MTDAQFIEWWRSSKYGSDLTDAQILSYHPHCKKTVIYALGEIEVAARALKRAIVQQFTLPKVDVIPECFGSKPGAQTQAENDCHHCKHNRDCL